MLKMYSRNIFVPDSSRVHKAPGRPERAGLNSQYSGSSREHISDNKYTTFGKIFQPYQMLISLLPVTLKNTSRDTILVSVRMVE